MRKIFLSIVTVFCVIVTSQAQTNDSQSGKISFGAKGALNNANFAGDDAGS